MNIFFKKSFLLVALIAMCSGSMQANIIETTIHAGLLELMSESLATKKPGWSQAAGATITGAMALSAIGNLATPAQLVRNPSTKLIERETPAAVLGRRILITALVAGLSIIPIRYAKHAKLIAQWRAAMSPKQKAMWKERVKRFRIMNIVGGVGAISGGSLISKPANIMNLVNFFRALHFMRTQVRDALKWKKIQLQKVNGTYTDDQDLDDEEEDHDTDNDDLDEEDDDDDDE